MKLISKKILSITLITILILISTILPIASNAATVPSISMISAYTSDTNGLTYGFNIKNIGKTVVDLNNARVKFLFYRNGANMSDLRFENLGNAPISGNFNEDISDYSDMGDTCFEVKLANTSTILQPNSSSDSIFNGAYKVRIYALGSAKIYQTYGSYYEETTTYTSDEYSRKVWVNGALVEDVHKFNENSDSGIIYIVPKFPTPIRNLDISVSLSADKTKYSEGQIITYTIDYANKYNVESGVVYIKALIPEHTIIQDVSGGKVTGNVIEWTINSLKPYQSGKIVYTVKVDNLIKAEVYVTNTVTLSAPKDILQNTEDDSSTIKVLLFSTKINSGYHSLYVVGYPDTLFKPENNVTRAEVATIFARVSGYDYNEPTGGIYGDVPASHWASGFISKASKELNLFTGYPDGSFQPNKAITRAELAIVTTKFLKTGSSAPFVVHFSDIEGHWAKSFIEQAYRNKIVAGYNDNSFRPNDNIKRSEMVTMVNKMLYRGPLHVNSPTFPDVQSMHWAYEQIEEAAINHNFYRNLDNGNEIMK